MSDKCYLCGTNFLLLEERYRITSQIRKYEKRKLEGHACIECVENNGCRTNFSLWNGEMLPEVKS